MDTNKTEVQAENSEQSEKTDNKLDTQNQSNFMTNEAFNTAIAKRNKQLENKIQEMLTASLGAKAEKAETPEVKTVSQDSVLADMQNRLARAEAKEQKIRQQNKSQSIKNGLLERNVKPELVDYIAEYHSKFIDYKDADSDELFYNDSDGTLDLKDALDAIIKSDRAKHFIKGAETKGSGDMQKRPAQSNSIEENLNKQRERASRIKF